MSTELTLPTFYDPSVAEDFHFDPNVWPLYQAAEQWRAQHSLRSAATDQAKVHLLLIDVQRDFCHPEGTLYVGGRSGDGAIKDNQRIAEFIYRNLPNITSVQTTLDTHFTQQIFFPWFWQDAERNGAAPDPHTIVTVAEIESGRFSPNPAIAGLFVNGNVAWLNSQVKFYCQQLEAEGKYQLYLWPPHCLLGTAGHALSGIINEARLFHAFARTSQSLSEIKGGHPLTENYSVISPEVSTRFDGNPLTEETNTAFLETLLGNDVIIIAGQAASHCVKSSIDDLLQKILARNPDLARKVYILRDCMSAVTVPDGQGGFVADFTDDAAVALDKFAAAGMHVVDSTTPIGNWSEIPSVLQ